jgi:hypothetical protein
MVLHGEMEGLINPTGIGFTKYYFWFHNFGFKLGKKHTKYITLGEPIKQNILKKHILKANQIINIDHPYNYISNIPIQYLDLPLRIGLIGRANKQKHAELIFELGQLLSHEIKEGNVVVEIIGTIETIIYQFVNEYVVCQKRDKFISNEEYFRKIEQLHYILCFFDDSNYKAVPSGTFFDAIKFKKPLLMLKGNDFMDYYQYKFPQIATSFENNCHMAEYIKEMVNKIELYKSDYDIQVIAMEKVKEQLSNINIIKSFRDQINENWY